MYGLGTRRLLLFEGRKSFGFAEVRILSGPFRCVKDTTLTYSKNDGTDSRLGNGVKLDVEGAQSSGDNLASVSVPKGTSLFVSIAGANRHEAVWGPDAKEWKPERWLESAPETEKGEFVSGKQAWVSKDMKLPGVYSGM